MTNLSIITSTTATMTSLELVDFINSQRDTAEAELTHANFMAKVPKVLGEGGLIQFQDTYVQAQNGQTYPCFKLPKREACLMAMSYSYELQAKVFDKMTALETQSAVLHLPDFNNPILAARAWADQAEQVQQLSIESADQQQQLAEIQPKAEALDRIATADGSFCIRDTAKTLQMREKDLKSYLLDNKWLYRRLPLTGYFAFEDKRLQGLIEHKTIQGERGDGSEWVAHQARITPKGLTRLATELELAFMAAYIFCFITLLIWFTQ
jgi:phage antirepressor YoqD-like protein